MSNNGFDWDQVEVEGDRPPWVEWTTVGDKFIGTITHIRQHVFPAKKDEEAKPTWVLDMVEYKTEEPRSLKLGPFDLRRQIKAIAPQKGDMLIVTYTGNEKVPGAPQPMKLFEVRHKPGERQAVAPADPEPEPEYSDEPF